MSVTPGKLWFVTTQTRTTKKMSRKQAAGWLCALEIVFFVGLIDSLQRHDWSGALFAFAVVTGIPTGVVARHTATTCGFITQAGKPCPNRVYGVIFGCGNAKHHTWGKVLQRFGRNANAIRPPERSPESSATSGVEPPEPMPVRIASGPPRDMALFWLAFGQLVVGVPSFIATIWPLLS